MKPVVVTPPIASDELFVASVTVARPADPNADATAAIQSAIDQAAAAGGAVVYLPPGIWRLDGHLLLKEGVTLLGGGQTETILAVYGGRGDANAPPTIAMQRGTGLRYLSIWHPEQRVDAPVPYPWTLHTTNEVGGDNITIEHVRLVNPWLAIGIGPEWNELHTVRQVTGCPLKIGIQIDTCTDIGRVVEVDFAPEHWAQSGLPGAPDAAVLGAWLAREATGLDMGRSDWQYVDGLRVRGYAVGMAIRAGAQGTTNGVLLDCHLSGTVGLRLERLNGIGLAANRCSFAGTAAAVQAPSSFDTVAQFNACQLSSPSGPALVNDGNGTLTLHHCTLDRGEGGPAIDAAGGHLLLQACRFPRQRGVRLGERVRRARILSTAVDPPAELIDESTGDVQQAAGVAPELCPEPAPSDLAWPKLPTRNLILVTEHGASPAAEDNTAAFQAALDAARAAGGGTVYVPAGRYRFGGEITVPTGVELRGIFDVPHHTQSDGSVLMITANRGNADGTPFCRLEARSGLRGLTFWYPEQDLREFAPYPWTVQSLGPGCWLRDVTCGNSYNGVDFWTNPSDGHVISYLAGAYFNTGLRVSKCAGRGWVEDVQFNPHYSARLPAGMPQPQYPGDVFGGVIEQQRHYLKGLVFGRCDDERIRRTFLYAAYDGLAFVDDGGGGNATVLIHGSDTVSRPVAFEAAGERGFECQLLQLVPLSNWAVGGFVSTPTFRGTARCFNNQMWAGGVGGVLQGGTVLIQQWNNLTGPLRIDGGDVTVESALFPERGDAAVTVGPAVGAAPLVANAQRGAFRIANGAGDKLTALANSASVRPRNLAAPFRFGSGAEDGEPQPLVMTIQAEGGGVQNISNGSCSVVDGAGRDGSRAIRIAGTPDPPGHGYVYFRLFDGPLAIYDDTVLTYWFRPGNEAGRNVGIDALLDEGPPLRDAGVQQADGVGVHPGQARGAVGEWTRIGIPLGRQLAGRVLNALMLAYDSQQAREPFEAFCDQIELRSELGGQLSELRCEPAGGRVPAGATATITAPAGTEVVYTLDGTNPTADSPRAAGPIPLPGPGLAELRYALLRDGRVGPLIFSALFEVLPAGGR